MSTCKFDFVVQINFRIDQFWVTNFSDRSHFLQTLFPPVSQFGRFGWFIDCWSTEHQMQSQWTPLLWHHNIFAFLLKLKVG